MDKPARVALITGVSSGIGKATAHALAEHGYRVFGTARSSGSSAPAKVERIVLDVRDAASIEAGVRDVLGQAGRIDLLVNNAGESLVGSIEETSVDQAEAPFEVNFFGAARTTQAVLPVMRTQRSGRIVFISSVLGFLPAPFMAFYAASKHALEALAESLDHEVRTLGIRSVLVEPSYMRTQLGAHSTVAASHIEDYAAMRQRAAAIVRDRVSGGEDPEIVAAAVLEAATSPRPRLRYRVGKDAAQLARLRRYLPAQLFDGGLRKQFGLHG